LQLAPRYIRFSRTQAMVSSTISESPKSMSEGHNKDETSSSASLTFMGRAAVVCDWRRILRPGEVAGGLGDLGTFLPDVVALGTNPLGPAIPVASVVFFSGLWSIWVGLLFDIPMPIQPMHTVVAVCLTEGLTYAELVASGVLLGGVMLLLGAFGLVDAIQQHIPLSVVRGLQLGLGLKTFQVGAQLVLKTGAWWTGDGNLDGYAIAFIAAVVVLLSYGHEKIPSSIVLFAMGMMGVVLSRPAVGTHLGVPIALVPVDQLFLGKTWLRALFKAALPQLPVTLLNAVVATARLSKDLYPGKPAAPDKISASIGFMNLGSAWFGHFPSCHGCGGLAAQHLFGARTGTSMVFVGVAKIMLACWCGPSLLAALQVFPKGIVGVLLALAGLELAVPSRDMTGRRDTAVMLLGAGLVLSMGTGVAFVTSLVAAVVLERRGAFDRGEECCPPAEPAS